METMSVTQTKKILIVDDDGPLSRMVAMTLRSSGYQTAIAGNGLVGLEQVEAVEPDLIVLDLKMPVMDGRTFYRELRARGIETPVLLLSAYGVQDARRELSAQAALSKPFMPQDLTDMIGSLLAGQNP
jgi:CheY-like chemotaxis protein